MKNPLDQFRSQLFGSRGCDITEALNYVDELATASTDSVAVQTAARVLLNTCANAVAQVMNAPSPEKLALIELIDQRILENKLVRTEDLESKVQDWIECNLDFDDMISEWMGNNFDITDHDDNIDWDTQLGNRISEWMSDNLEDKINDLELVVKVK